MNIDNEDVQFPPTSDYPMHGSDDSDSSLSDEEDTISPVTKIHESVPPMVQTLAGLTAKFPHVPAEQRKIWAKTTTRLTKPSGLPTYKFAFIGKTGCGKSTLINCLLRHAILPSSATGLHFVRNRNILHRFSLPQGHRGIYYEGGVAGGQRTDHSDSLHRQELKQILEDISNHADASVNAKQRLFMVYPDLHNKELAAVNVQLLLQKDTVKRKLGSSTVIEAPTSSIFRTKLEEFLSSSASSTQPMLWPLVRRVEIRGNFAVLSTGITLVDLPGHGDNDDSRNNFADDYIKTADGIVFVTDARRAQNDRTTVEHMRTTLSQLLIDGRSVEESILVVATGTDSQIQGADEVKLSGADRLTVDTLTNQIQELKKITLSSKNPKKHSKNKSTKPQNQHEIDEQIKNENQERVLILANARIAGVRKGVKDVFADLYGHMSSDEREAPKLSVYCVGSFDYLALTGSGNMPTIFHDVDMTEIPSLMSHLQSTGERRRLKWASRLFADADTFYEAVHHYFADGRHPGRLHTDNKTKALQLVRELDNSNKQRVKDLFDEIKDEFEQLAADLDKAVGTAAEQSIVVVKEFSKEMRYPSYKACMKNNGHHNSRDLNHELTRRILPAVQNNWNTVVNHRIPLLLKNVMEHIEDDTLAAIPRIVEALDIRGPRFEGLAESARRSLGIEVYISEMLGQSIQSIILAQRNGTRSFKNILQTQMIPQYKLVFSESGAGAFQRMKDLNQAYIEQNHTGLFHTITIQVQNSLNDSVSKVKAYVRTELSDLTRMIQVCLIDDVNLSAEHQAAKKAILDVIDENKPVMAILQIDLGDRKRALGV